MEQTEQQFLNSLDKKLWLSADKLRSNLDAAVYKHAVLGLIFVKYVSDAFAERRKELEAHFRDKDHDYYLGVDEALIQEELEIRDYYTEKNVFWVPELARWKTLQDNAKLPIGTEITIKNGKKTKYKITSVGRLIDDALDAIEKENPKLKGVLNKTYASLELDAAKLGELIDLVATIPFHHATLGAKDILGHVYEYFLGQFALAEGKKGGQYYTPKAIVTLIVEMLQPYKGRVYDPAMGSGGFFVQSESFIEEHQGKLGLPVRGTQTGNISVYGQESNPTTWRLAAMNMAIRGIDFNFGKEPANSFTNDKHPDLRADYVMANPPFNMKQWWDAKLEGDPRWQHGTPPKNNANFAWMQHMLYHLAPNGSLALLLANGSMSSNTNGEGEIRKNLLENDIVECMVALPGQLFTNTQIPACIWFLTKNKKGTRHSTVPSTRHSRAGGNPGFRDRSGEVLFIDARNMGYMKDRVLRDFKPEDIRNIADTYHAWQTNPPQSQWHSLKKSTHSLKGMESFFKKTRWLTEFCTRRDSCCRLGIGCTPFSNRFHRDPWVLPAGACFLPAEADGIDHAVQRITSQPCLPKEQRL
ncbi:MAG: type I restriction-modification system subunit M [Gammaproteobacteria bacterium]|nr:type I restriction-modification system subunit M [Gammaproteobacteria bacterium]